MKFKSSLFICATLLALSGCGKTDNPEPENILNSIEIDCSLAKVNYKEGDLLDPSNLLIKCNYTKGEISIRYEECPAEFSFLPSLETELKTSDTSVKVTYKGKSNNYSITVSEVETEYDEYSVNFATIDLGTSGILQSSDSTFKNKIMGYINQGKDFLSDVEVEDPSSNGVKIQKKEFYGDYGSAQGLIIGGQQIDGKITFTFAKELSYVIIKAQQYYNPQLDYATGTPYVNPNYDGQEYIEIEEDPGYYFEGYFKLGVNDTSWRGTGEGIEYDEDWNILIKTPEINERKFDINSSSLVIEGYASERARILEMTFGFEK